MRSGAGCVAVERRSSRVITNAHSSTNPSNRHLFIGAWLRPSNPGLLRFFSRFSMRFSTLALARFLSESLRFFCFAAICSSVRSTRAAHFSADFFFILCSFLTLFCRSFGSFSTFSPPARAKAASQE